MFQSLISTGSSKVSGHREVIRTGDVGVTESFHPFCSLLLKRENTSLKQQKSLVSLAQAARLIIGNAFFFVFRTQKGSHVKENNEGVKSQIKEIKEDINKLGNDGFNVEVKLDELEQYARGDCLEITGIPVVTNDSPALLVKEMSEIMGVSLNESDIRLLIVYPQRRK